MLPDESITIQRSISLHPDTSEKKEFHRYMATVKFLTIQVKVISLFHCLPDDAETFLHW